MQVRKSKEDSMMRAKEINDSRDYEMFLLDNEIRFKNKKFNPN